MNPKNITNKMLGRSIYNSVADVERDYKLAIRSGGEYTKEEYVTEALENSDVTFNDKILLKKWLRR